MVRLIAVGPEKIQTIKILKEYIIWDLSTALEKVELALPAIIVTNMPLFLAQELKAELAKLDTVIEIINL
jgi:hypothetical protein